MTKSKRNAISARAEANHFGKELSFAASEAYKLLRTNLMFFTHEDSGCVVGVTSSLSGEGKSTTTINLAYVLAESGRKVILIECDLRRPTIARRLQIQASPGLSNLIVGLSSAEEVLCTCDLHEKLHVIPAGDIPPNPSELLGSERMRLVIESLAAEYDFVLLDLPPVTAVSDALVAANLTDGMIIVVRQDVCSRHALAETMHQMEVVKEKILGFVFTSSDDRGGSYYKRKKYYNRGYGYGYGYGYGERQTKPTQEDVSSQNDG